MAGFYVLYFVFICGFMEQSGDFLKESVIEKEFV